MVLLSYTTLQTPESTGALNAKRVWAGSACPCGAAPACHCRAEDKQLLAPDGAYTHTPGLSNRILPVSTPCWLNMLMNTLASVPGDGGGVGVGVGAVWVRCGFTPLEILGAQGHGRGWGGGAEGHERAAHS